VNQTGPKNKKIHVVKRAAIFLGVFTLSLLLRSRATREIGPYDDAYHWKRIAYSASHFPHVLAFDSDRDAWCPWPPLYDLGMSLAGTKHLIWVPPVAFSLLAATLAITCGWIAGLGVALAPYLIDVSSVARIDHHWLEPALVVAILFARKRPMLLAIAMTCALFVQPALIIACGLVFFVADREAARSFAFAAAAVVVYRLTNAYPDNGWFLGWPHAALLTAAAIALLLKPKWYAIPIGAAIALPWLPQILEGMLFIRGDRWFRSIVEFQPLFHDPSKIGTDIANIGGGVIALLLCVGRASARPVGLKPDPRPITLFAIAYLLLAISSQRFLVPAIPLFAIAGQMASVDRKWIAAALTLLPALCYDVHEIAPHPLFERPLPSARGEGPRSGGEGAVAIAREIAKLPPGRVLAPWYMGHAIDVFGHHAVVIDNFGTMPDATRFELATEALENPRIIRAYCKLNHVRYVVMNGEIWPMK
jgi:hypothetical protein